MDVKGIVTGVVRDAKTGAFKRSFTVENDVTDYWLGVMASGFPFLTSTGRFGPYIFIADGTNTLQTPREEYVGNVLAAGTTEAGVTSPIHVTPPIDTGSPKLKTPPYIQLQQRFAPPLIDRVITIIGLTVDTPTSSNIVDFSRARAQTYVPLTPTCSQTTTETLDIFYRIQFLYTYDLEDPDDVNVSPSEVGISKTTASIAAQRYSIASDQYFFGFHHAWHASGNFNINKTSIAYIYDFHDYVRNGTSPQPISTTIFTDLVKTDMNMDYDISMYQGKFIGSFGYGENGSGQTLIHDCRSVISIADSDSPLQGVFGHNSSATKPFFDSVTSQSGTGVFTPNADSWTNPDFPKMYRVDIVTGGATNSATYRIKVRNHLGFDGNAYRDQERAQLQMVGGNSISNFEGFDIARPDTGWFDYNHPTKKWHGLAANPTELCVIDLSRQTGIRTDLSGAGVTKVGSVVVDDQTIWIPCRETGLYKVLDPSQVGGGTVTMLPIPPTTGGGGVDRCLGVGLTPNAGGTPKGRLWAIWSDSVGDYSLNTDLGLYWTEDEGVLWTKDTTWAPETIIYWNNASFNFIPHIIADPNHVDMRLLIAYTLNAPTTIIHYLGMWHDQVAATQPGPDGFAAMGYYSNLSTPSDVGYRAYIGTDPRSFGNVPSVSPDGVSWGGPASQSTTEYNHYYVYGATSALRTSQSLYGNWIKDENGDYALLSVNDIATFSIGAWKPDNTKTVEPVVVSGQDYSTRYAVSNGGLLYLGEGVFFGSSYSLPLTFTDKPDATGNYSIAVCNPADSVLGHALPDLNVWADYGWDGSNWVPDPDGTVVPGVKPTHDVANDLIDGVTIVFTGTTAGSWVTDDYYTFGVADGVWLDGSTEFHHTASLYQKPTTMKNNAIEAALLPSTPKTVDTNEYPLTVTHINASEIVSQGNNGRDFYINGTYTLDSWNKSTQIQETREVAATGDSGNSSDLHQGVEFRQYYTGSGALRTFLTQFILGFIPESKLGQVGSETSTDFAIRVAPATNLNNEYINISVVHLGVVQATYENFRQYYSTSVGADEFRIEIKKDGHIVYTVSSTSTSEIVLFDSSAGSPPPLPPIPTPFTDKYNIEYVTSGAASSGIRDLRLYGPSNLDYYVTLGDSGASTGFYNPSLYSIDYDTEFSVMIGGTEGVNVGPNVHGDDFNGNITPLNAGEYSLFRETGVIRYSAADAASGTVPIVVQYNEISND